jgi:hypothetical protein
MFAVKTVEANLFQLYEGKAMKEYHQQVTFQTSFFVPSGNIKLYLYYCGLLVTQTLFCNTFFFNQNVSLILYHMYWVEWKVFEEMALFLST